MNKKLLLVGEYSSGKKGEPPTIHRGMYGEGMIFKDEDAFLHTMDQTCYVPELSNICYSRRDFLRICNGQVEFAEQCFYALDWKALETFVEEMFTEAEWAMCPRCQQLYRMDGTPCACPLCGTYPEN